MVYQAKVEITTIQDNETGTTVTEGVVTCEHESVYIEFLDGQDKTCIGISPKIATITKIGSDSYTLILEEGKTTGTSANFDGIRLELSIHTNSVTLTKTDDTLNICLVYSLLIQDNAPIENTVNINCTRIK